MWPNLIPGDILRAVECPVENLRPGMIAVFSDNGQLIVHRVIRVGNYSGLTVVTTAGDRSGLDSSKRCFDSSDRVTVVTGVLRKGAYRRVGCLVVPLFLSPSVVVRYQSAIVRRFMW